MSRNKRNAMDAKIVSGLILALAAEFSPLAQAANDPNCDTSDGTKILSGGKCYYLDQDYRACRSQSDRKLDGDFCYSPAPVRPGKASDMAAAPAKASGSPVRTAVASAAKPDCADQVVSASRAIGPRVSAELSTIAGYVNNELVSGGGHEREIGDGYLMVKINAEQPVNKGPLKTVFVDVTWVNPKAVESWNEPSEQGFNNMNALKGTGILAQPYLLANVGAKFEVGQTQEITARVGSMPMAGLAPLEGKPTQYHANAPYNFIVRYDKGVRVDYKVQDEIGRIIQAYVSIYNGDGVKGERAIEPASKRANSYFSGAVGGEVRVLSLLSKTLGVGENLRKKGDIYFCGNINRGTTGSYAGGNEGEKRTQDDTDICVGAVANLGKDVQLEVRAARDTHVRNPAGNGAGSHSYTGLVNSKGNSVEVALRNLHGVGCDWDIYANRYQLTNLSGQPDGEFFPGQVDKVSGRTYGAKCRNVLGIKNLNLFGEVGRRVVTNPTSAGVSGWALQGDPNSGRDPFGVKYFGVEYSVQGNFDGFGR
jgi:hypothetical protein